MNLALRYLEVPREEYSAKPLKQEPMQPQLVAHIMLVVHTPMALDILHHIRIGLQAVLHVEDVQHTEDEVAVCIEVCPPHHKHIAMEEMQRAIVTLVLREVLVNDALALEKVIDVVRIRILLMHIIPSRDREHSRVLGNVLEALAVLVDANPWVAMVLPYVEDMIPFRIAELHRCQFILRDDLYRVSIRIGQRLA